MAVLKSSVLPGSETYRANHAAHLAMLEEVRGAAVLAAATRRDSIGRGVSG